MTEPFIVIELPDAAAQHVAHNARWVTTTVPDGPTYAAAPLRGAPGRPCIARARVTGAGVHHITPPRPSDLAAVEALTAMVARWGLTHDGRVAPAFDELAADGPQWLLAASTLCALDPAVLLEELAARADQHEGFRLLHAAAVAADADDPAVKELTDRAGTLGRGTLVLALNVLDSPKQEALIRAVCAEAPSR